MNRELYDELNILMNQKFKYETFLEDLKNKPYSNKIVLSKGLAEFYFGDDLLSILIDYYENELKKINTKIGNFRLYKTTD